MIIIGIAVGAAVVYYVVKSRSPTARYVVSQPKTYNNLETWEFMKDERGRVTGVRIKREAKEN